MNAEPAFEKNLKRIQALWRLVPRTTIWRAIAKLAEELPSGAIPRALVTMGLRRRQSLMLPIAIAGGAALAGFGLGMLLAPVKGSEARKYLTEQIDKLIQRLTAEEGGKEPPEERADSAPNPAPETVDADQTPPDVVPTEPELRA